MGDVSPYRDEVMFQGTRFDLRYIWGRVIKIRVVTKLPLQQENKKR